MISVHPNSLQTIQPAPNFILSYQWSGDSDRQKEMQGADDTNTNTRLEKLPLLNINKHLIFLVFVPNLDNSINHCSLITNNLYHGSWFMVLTLKDIPRLILHIRISILKFSSKRVASGDKSFNSLFYFFLGVSWFSN